MLTEISWHIGCTVRPRRTRKCGRRSTWQKKIVASRRWTGASSATSPARAAKPRIRRVPRTSGPARRRVKPAARAAWRAIAASRNSGRRQFRHDAHDTNLRADDGRTIGHRRDTDATARLIPVSGAALAGPRFGTAIIRSSAVRRARLALGGRPTVGHLPLEQVIGVRIPASQPIL